MYNFGDPNEVMVDKECTCYFHWTQSMDRHTKQQIKPNLHELDIKHCAMSARMPHHWKKLMFDM